MSGFFCRHSQHHEPDHAADEEEGEEADEAGGEPVVLFALVEHDLHAAHGDGEECEAHVVHVAQLRRIGLDPRRIFDQARDEKESEDADGNVDEEDPAPGEVVGDPAAERGADGWREHGDEAVEREGLSALVRLERVGHDGLRHGLHAAAACSLNDAKDQQHGKRRRGAAEETGNGEDGDAEDEEVAPAHQARRPSAERQHDGVGDQIAGQHPRALIGAGAEAAGDMRQRDVGDGGVEHLHESGQSHGGSDQPGIDAWLPVRMISGVGIDHRRGLRCSSWAPAVLSATRAKTFSPGRFAALVQLRGIEKPLRRTARLNDATGLPLNYR